MKITRLFTDSDGISRFEDLALATHPDLAQARAASGVYFKEFAPGTVLPLHPAPRRQVVVVLSGALELDAGDGQVRRFGPGDARVMEDTTGRGHVTRVIGSDPALVLVVPLIPSC